MHLLLLLLLYELPIALAPLCVCLPPGVSIDAIPFSSTSISCKPSLRVFHGLVKNAGNVVELRYSQADSIKQGLLQLFKLTGYKPLILLDATAQIALSHHLDDEVSKQMSVAVNTRAMGR